MDVGGASCRAIEIPRVAPHISRRPGRGRTHTRREKWWRADPHPRAISEVCSTAFGFFPPARAPRTRPGHTPRAHASKHAFTQTKNSRSSPPRHSETLARQPVSRDFRAGGGGKGGLSPLRPCTGPTGSATSERVQAPCRTVSPISRTPSPIETPHPAPLLFLPRRLTLVAVVALPVGVACAHVICVAGPVAAVVEEEVEGSGEDVESGRAAREK